MSKVNLQSLPFTKAFDDITSKAHKVDQKFFQLSGDYPIIDQGQNFIAAYINDKSLVWGEDLPVVIFGDHTRILKFVNFPFVLGADGTKVLKPCDSLWPKYAYYALQKIDIPSAGYSRHFKFLKEEKISFPPLPEQQRIAAILDKADRLLCLRRFALELGASYLQSIFLDMFGDPVANPMGWEVTNLGNILEIITYGLTVRPKYIPSGYPLISAREIRSGTIDFEGAPKISETDFEKLSDKAKPEFGDILFSKTGTIGHCAVVKSKQPFAITQNVARLAFDNQKFFNEFVITFLRSDFFQDLADGEAKGNAVRDLQLGVMKRFPIYIPPLPEQEKFVQIMHRYEILRFQQHEALRQSEHLFQSLMARVYEGGL